LAAAHDHRRTPVDGISDQAMHLGTAARVDQWGPRQRDTPAPEEHGGSEGDKQDEQQQPNDPR
jgi:hypothetical protein